MLGIGLGLTQPRNRGAAFSPLDIPDLAGWWDASDTTTITEASGSVSQIDDKSGNNRNLVQSLLADQPATGTATVNGLNVLSYDGDDWLRASTTFATTASGITMVAVMQHIAEDWTTIGVDASVPFVYAAQDGSTATNLHNGFTGAALRVDGVAQSPVTRQDVYDSMAEKLSVVSVTGVFTGNPSVLFVPLSYPITGFRPESNWCEAMFYSRQLTTVELGQVEQYLGRKWGVTIA